MQSMRGIVKKVAPNLWELPEDLYTHTHTHTHTHTKWWEPWAISCSVSEKGGNHWYSVGIRKSS